MTLTSALISQDLKYLIQLNFGFAAAAHNQHFGLKWVFNSKI